jgi:hypothetical protein
VEGIGDERAIVPRQGRAKLTPDLSDHHGLMWRLGAIERRETRKRIMILGRVPPECHRLLGDNPLGRPIGAPMNPRPRGPTRLRGSPGFRGPSRDGSVSVKIVCVRPGKQHL